MFRRITLKNTRVVYWVIRTVRRKMTKQAGAELCQAQDQVDLLAESEFILRVESKIQIHFFGYFQLFGLSSIKVILHFSKFKFILAY